MRRRAALAVLGILLGTACSGSNANKPAVVPTASATVASQAAASTPARSQSAAANVPAAGATTNAAIEERLTKASLQDADVPAGLQLGARRPWSNKDYAGQQSDAAAFQQVLESQGRLDGVLVQYLQTVTPTAAAPATLGVIEILSAWQSENGATAGLLQTLKAVTPQGAQPNTVKAEQETVDLGLIGSNQSAVHLHVTPLAPGQPVSDAYIVGVRKGTDTVLMIVSGQSGAPDLDTVKRLITLQVQRLG